MRVSSNLYKIKKISVIRKLQSFLYKVVLAVSTHL